MNDGKYLWIWMDSYKSTRITIREVIIAGIICHFFEDSIFWVTLPKWVRYRLLATIIGCSFATSQKLYKIWVKRRKKGIQLYFVKYSQQELLSILDEYYGRLDKII